MMSKCVIALGLCVLITVGAQGAPIPATYEQQSADMLGGRWSESYDAVGNGPSLVGNTLQASSWDGVALGDEWELTGATLASDISFPPQVFGDTQILSYLSTYDGGTLTLKATGSWNPGGDPDYTVILENFTQSTTVVSYLGEVLQVTSTISMQGDIPAYPGYEMNYLAAVGTIVGEGAVPPPGYPSIAAANGQWGDVNSVKMQIVPEPATMSLLALGGLALIRRRNR